MWNSKFFRYLFSSLFVCFCLFGTISAQQTKNEYQPKYSVKSAIVQYKLTRLKNWTGDSTVSAPYFNVIFDAYGALARKELLFAEALDLLHDPLIKIYRDDYVFLLDDPKGCATKRKIRNLEYSEDLNGAGRENMIVQNLINKKINKENNKAFRSFTKIGTELFLGFNCIRYQYIRANFITTYLVYHDICLSTTYYYNSTFISSVVATSFEENIAIPPLTFEVPAKYRLIDGDKLDKTYKEAASGFSSIIVNYTTKTDYYQTKAEGKKTLYSKDQGKKSVWEWEETISQYNLAPVSTHCKIIRDEECEFLVNYIKKTVNRGSLVTSNYNYKSIAELNYLFENKLYDTTVKVLGKINFLGKECTIYAIITGIEKLEVYEWQGVFLKVKQYTCTDGPDCNQYILIGEETATTIQENVPISDSLFEYPESFSRN